MNYLRYVITCRNGRRFIKKIRVFGHPFYLKVWRLLSATPFKQPSLTEALNHLHERHKDESYTVIAVTVGKEIEDDEQRD